MVQRDQSHDCIDAGIALLLPYFAFVATTFEDFGQGLVEATLPQFVFGMDPTTCNIKTLDCKTTAVPEPNAANGWLWRRPPRWGWMKLDLPPPQHVGGGAAPGGRIGVAGVAAVVFHPSGRATSPLRFGG